MVHLERSDEYAIEFMVTTILTTVQEISAFAAQAVKVYGEAIFGALWSTLFTDQDVQPRSSSSNPWPSISERQLNARRTQHFTDTTREYNQFRLSFHEVIEEPDNLLESRFDHLRLQLSAMAGILAGRRAYITSKGYLGLGPGDLQPGDIIVAFLGAEVPTSIRPRDSGMHQMVGETYVHGLMDGEVMDMGLPTSAFHVLWDVLRYSKRGCTLGVQLVCERVHMRDWLGMVSSSTGDTNLILYADSETVHTTIGQWELGIPSALPYISTEPGD
jgi:hypothetical protein